MVERRVEALEAWPERVARLDWQFGQFREEVRDELRRRAGPSRKGRACSALPKKLMTGRNEPIYHRGHGGHGDTEARPVLRLRVFTSVSSVSSVVESLDTRTAEFLIRMRRRVPRVDP